MTKRSDWDVIGVSYIFTKSCQPEQITALGIQHHQHSATCEQKDSNAAPGRENGPNGSKDWSYPASYGSVRSQADARSLWVVAAVGGRRTEGLKFCTGETWNSPSSGFRVYRQSSGKILKTQTLAALSQCNQDKQVRQRCLTEITGVAGQGIFRVCISKWFELKFQKASPPRENPSSVLPRLAVRSVLLIKFSKYRMFSERNQTLDAQNYRQAGFHLFQTLVRQNKG